MLAAMIRLQVDDDGAGAPSGGPVFVLLHGFTTDGTAWAPVRAALRRFGRTVAVDLIGHGRSPAPEDVSAYTMTACLAQLDGVLEALGLPAAWWVGYSMGARVALQMAAIRPHRVRGLIVESGTAGLETAAERARRAAEDETLALRIEAVGVAAFVEEWLARPLFAGLARLPPEQRAAQRERRLKNSARGLAHSLRGMGTGAMAPLWSALADVRVPTLFIAGEQDAKFVAIARRMSGLVPGSLCVAVPGSGHTVHAEQPEAWMAAAVKFLEDSLA